VNNFTNTVLWIYIVLLLVGGLFGFYKAKSKVSLITSAVFAALLALLRAPKIFDRNFAFGATDVLLAALLLVFAIRLAKTKNFMPAGLLLVATAVMLILWNLFRGAGAG
jgi:uncharacterized membrane protein (UPF0136 family)